MRFGVCVMANVDEIGFFNHAETLGYDSVWVTDSQMLFSDCYAVLALAARQTTRLRLGPGTAICGTRIPPVLIDRTVETSVRPNSGWSMTRPSMVGIAPMLVTFSASRTWFMRVRISPGRITSFTPTR